MFIRKLKHHSWIKFAGFMLKLSPGVSYMLFAGQASSRQLCLHMARGGSKRVLVVTDRPLVELGVVAQATSGLHEAGLEVVVFDGVLPDPTYQVVAEGKAVYERENCDCILAIGGGSSIDAAKVIGLALSHEGEPRDYVGFGKVKNPLPPFYTIPTTSGTGSEATMGAVISDNVSHEKGIISGATLLPLAACLDADLLTGLPPHITAATGMDALTHAVEAYIGVWERGDSMKTSATAVKLIFQHLPDAYSNGGDVEVRAEMAYAAYLAGQAINMVNVGNVHAIAHQLGAFYGVPHGLANAQVMPHVLDLSLESARERLTELAQMIGLSSAEEFISAVRELNQTVGIPATVEKLKAEDFPVITERAIAEADGYPVPYMLSKGDVQSILEKLS
jgi:alcohol dehydrogenase class IV